MTTSERIRELCKQQGISVTLLEKELGFGNGSLTKKDTTSIKADRLFAIAKRLNVSMEYLLGETAEETYYNNPETAKVADRLLHQEGFKVLFDASENAEPRDLLAAAELLKSLKKIERGGNDDEGC